MTFEISRGLIEKINLLVQEQNNAELLLHFEDLHFADIAEILDEISLEEATYIVKLLDSYLFFRIKFSCATTRPLV